MQTKKKKRGKSQLQCHYLILDKVVFRDGWGSACDGTEEGFRPFLGTGWSDSAGSEMMIVSSMEKAEVSIETFLAFG